MSDCAIALILELERRDAASFARICRDLQRSEEKRQEVATGLMDLVRAGEVPKAQSALEALRFSGLAAEPATSATVVTAAEERFPPEALTRLAADEAARERQGTTKLPDEICLLKSFIMAILRSGNIRGETFVRLVEREFEATRLPRRISAWRDQSK